MHTKPNIPRTFWSVTRRVALRALFGSTAAAAVGVLFFALGGAVLCLANGVPWSFAGFCALRGGFAGLIAGALVGAISGVYHVDAALPAAENVENCSPELANCNRAPVRAPKVPLRNGKIHSRLG